MAGTSGIRSVVDSIRRSLNLDSRKATDAKPAKSDTSRPDSGLYVAPKDSLNGQAVPEVATPDDKDGVEYQDVVIAGVMLPDMSQKYTRDRNMLT
jgi:hypothetical protein